MSLRRAETANKHASPWIQLLDFWRQSSPTWVLAVVTMGKGQWMWYYGLHVVVKLLSDKMQLLFSVRV